MHHAMMVASGNQPAQAQQLASVPGRPTLVPDAWQDQPGLGRAPCDDGILRSISRTTYNVKLSQISNRPLGSYSKRDCGAPNRCRSCRRAHSSTVLLRVLVRSRRTHLVRSHRRRSAPKLSLRRRNHGLRLREICNATKLCAIIVGHT